VLDALHSIALRIFDFFRNLFSPAEKAPTPKNGFSRGPYSEFAPVPVPSAEQTRGTRLLQHRISVGAPCFSRGKLDFSPAEKAYAPKTGFSRGPFAFFKTSNVSVDSLAGP
jgi:hypothetical protein